MTCCQTSVKQSQINVEFGRVAFVNMADSTMTCIFKIDSVFVDFSKQIQMKFGTVTCVKEAGSISTLFIHRKVTYYMLFQYLQHSRELGHYYGHQPASPAKDASQYTLISNHPP